MKPWRRSCPNADERGERVLKNLHRRGRRDDDKHRQPDSAFPVHGSGMKHAQSVGEATDQGAQAEAGVDCVQVPQTP